MNDLKQLLERKQKLGSISAGVALGLPIFLSFSRVFREWATWAVTPYRALTPIYIFGLLYAFFKYRKTLHEIIVLKLSQDSSGASLERDEQATVNELRVRKNRIDTLPWIKRNSWLLFGVLASAGVFTFLWSLAKHIDKSPILSVLFAIFATGVLGIYYWRREYFTRREKTIVLLLPNDHRP